MSDCASVDTERGFIATARSLYIFWFMYDVPSDAVGDAADGGVGVGGLGGGATFFVSTGERQSL
jgi:hypothetical protein